MSTLIRPAKKTKRNTRDNFLSSLVSYTVLAQRAAFILAGRGSTGGRPAGRMVRNTWQRGHCAKCLSFTEILVIPFQFIQFRFSDLSSIMFEARLVQGNLLKKVKLRSTLVILVSSLSFYKSRSWGWIKEIMYFILLPTGGVSYRRFTVYYTRLYVA